MKGKQLENIGNHVCEGGEKATKSGLNQLSKEITVGDIVWVKIHGISWWPAQVVDCNSRSGCNNMCKIVEGEIFVRLYGSYEYMHVDPLKYSTEFENVLKKRNWNLKEILKYSIERDLSRVKTSAKIKRKDSSSEESPTVEASKVKKKKQDKIQINQLKSPSEKPRDDIAQRVRQSSHLAGKAGYKSCKSERSKHHKVNTRPKADGPDSVWFLS